MNKKPINKLLIIVIAIALSFATIGTATFAWFSLNNRVKSTGMNLETTAPTNMLIAKEDPENPLSWSNGITAVTLVPGGFMPSSTNDGTHFFALASTSGISSLGGIISAVNRTDTRLASVGRKDVANTYYAEFALYVKASEQTNLTEDLEMALQSFTVSTTEHDLQNCVRVSVTELGTNTGEVGFNDNGRVFNLDGEGEITGDELVASGSTYVYKFDTSTTVKPIVSVDGNGVPTLADEDPAIAAGDDTVCYTVDYQGNDYTTIIVRIWLEGQHAACINQTSGETVNVSLNWKVKED